MARTRRTKTQLEMADRREAINKSQALLQQALMRGDYIGDEFIMNALIALRKWQVLHG